MKNINWKHFSLIIVILLILINVSSVSASYDSNETLEQNLTVINESETLLKSTPDLESEINNADNGDVILIEKGTYKIHNIKITKNITLQGHGDPRDVIIDVKTSQAFF